MGDSSRSPRMASSSTESPPLRMRYNGRTPRAIVSRRYISRYLREIPRNVRASAGPGGDLQDGAVRGDLDRAAEGVVVDGNLHGQAAVLGRYDRQEDVVGAGVVDVDQLGRRLQDPNYGLHVELADVADRREGKRVTGARGRPTGAAVIPLHGFASVCGVGTVNERVLGVNVQLVGQRVAELAPHLRQ